MRLDDAISPIEIICPLSTVLSGGARYLNQDLPIIKLIPLFKTGFSSAYSILNEITILNRSILNSITRLM
jgi:hypothetical protein